MTRRGTIGGLLLLALLLGSAGCTRTDTSGEKQKGWTVLGRTVVVEELAGKAGKLRPALDAPEATVVQVKGTIGEVCNAGCWFYLKDGDDMVYVDVEGDYAVPPTSTGRRALVVGTTDGDGGSRILKATTVCLK
jgi:hypothetical protein